MDSRDGIGEKMRMFPAPKKIRLVVDLLMMRWELLGSILYGDESNQCHAS